MFKRLASTFVILAFLCGCAIGNKYQYETSPPKIDVASSGEVAVGALDQRPYILSGDKDPDFVGLQRGGFGNPFDVTTETGDPLANDFADTIVLALTIAGVTARSVPLAASSDKDGAVQDLMNSGAEKSLLITMVAWKTDTYGNVKLEYDLTAEVYDRQGELLAQNQRAATKNLGGSVWNPPAHAREAVPRAFRVVMRDLLSDEKVVAALQ